MKADNSAAHRKLVADVRSKYGREPDLTLWLNSKGRWDAGEFKSTPGLGKGTADLIGVLTLKLLVKTGSGPGEDRWREFGILLAGEAKTGTGKLRPDQEMFMDLVLRRGGYAFVFTTVEEFGVHLNRARSGEWVQ